MNNGVIIKELSDCFREQGLAAGDIITEIDGRQVNDLLDFYFYFSEPESHIKIQREGRFLTLTVKREYEDKPAISVENIRIKRCGSRCVFCFVDQMPRGLRESLYIKDGDLSLCFLYGNYIALTDLLPSDIKRISEFGLSPLYVSVHATDPDVRSRMLGTKKAGGILPLMNSLMADGIAFHVQLVICPGINDGPVLEKTLADLLRLHPGVLSVALVPVGLTRFRKGLAALKAPDADFARKVIMTALGAADKYKKKNEGNILYLADEFYIKAGLPIPSYSYYNDFPQLENGVGMISRLEADIVKIRKKPAKPMGRKTRIGLITAVDAAPYIRKLGYSLQKAFPGASIKTIPVANRFFGKTVTVAGLLSGADVRKTVMKNRNLFDFIIVPDIIFANGGDITLDGVTRGEMSEEPARRVLFSGAEAGQLYGVINKIRAGK